MIPHQTDVVIVGAGPYGLSIAAHLAERAVPFRIFGEPMESWLTQMPQDMLLKSEGFASSLYDPDGRMPLSRYCKDIGLPYAGIGLPVPLKTFCDYGLAFQQALVPSLDRRKVANIRQGGAGYILDLDDGEQVAARRVVMAVGISHFSYVPPVLAALAPAFVTHSSMHRDITRFKGRDVVVIGGGASAVDLAAPLHEAGATVRLAARRSMLEIHTKMRLPRPLADRVGAPMTGIGPSWRSWFFTHGAALFRYFPQARRLKWLQSHLGPAGGWFMAHRIWARVPLLLGHTPVAAEAVGDKVRLTFSLANGSTSQIETEHVIAATGYRPDLDRLTFLDRGLRERIAAEDGVPVLSARFQSSVPGLYFVGPAAVNSFGPLMRFAVGAKFTAPRLARHLAATALRAPSRSLAFSWTARVPRAS